MRIIAGLARGIRLSSPQDDAIRPTEDKVKESLFGTLGNLQGTRVLDLFSGTGALGLEALSRGAAHVTLVEKDPRHADVIRQNLAAVRKAMAPAEPGEAFLQIGDARNAAGRLSAETPYDFILADPPYHTLPGQYGPQEMLLDAGWCRLAHPGTILVLEHAADVRDLPWSPRSPWKLLRERTFGIRVLAYARLASPEDSAEGVPSPDEC